MNAQEEWEKVHESTEAFMANVIRKILPNAKLSSSLIYGGLSDAKEFEGTLSSENMFKYSVYEHTGENDYLHFTTLQSLALILKHGFMRMSEFGNLEDHHELRYGARVMEGSEFNIEENDIEIFHENLFCFSMCQFSQKTILNPYLWEAYAAKTNGVCIRFKFTHPEPFGFHKGKILYGDSQLESLRQLKENALQHKPNSGIFPNNFSEMILALYAFHKAKKYEVEDEIRFIFYEHKDKYVAHKKETIYKDINKFNNVKYFNKIFLKNQNPILNEYLKRHGEIEDDILRFTPQIEITDIYLGSGLSPEQKTYLHDFLSNEKKINKQEYKLWHIHIDNSILPTC